MNTLLFVIAVFIGMVALIVLAAMLRGVASCLSSRWRAPTSNRQKRRPSIRNQTVVH
jgi:hypothetical protein